MDCGYSPGACDDLDACRALVGICPVDIFKEEGGRVVVDDDQGDECTLCGLCLQIASNAVKVEKLY